MIANLVQLLNAPGLAKPWIAACLALPVLILVFIFYLTSRFLFDALKLRRFPAPSVFAATTPLWCAANSYRGKRFISLQEAHESLGPIVRISSRHISFNDPDAVKDIYGHANGSKIMKDEFYDNLAGEFHNIANVRDREAHSRKRKYFSNAFSLKSISELEPIVHRYVSTLLEKLDLAERSAGTLPESLTVPSSTRLNQKDINMNKLLNFFTFDVIGDVAVGQSFGFLEKGTDTAVGQFKHATKGQWHSVPSTIDSLHAAFNFKVALGQLSRAWYLIAFKLLSWSQGKKHVDLFTSVAINQVRRRLERGCEHEHQDFFERVILDRDGKTRQLPFMEMVSEAIVLLNAGSDTTSSGLTSLVYEISKNPRIQARLQAELDGALSDDTYVARFDDVKSLPYLKACIDENLRLNPPIPYGPPRVVIDPQGVNIMGQHVLPGTTVSVPTYSVQRRADVFPDPGVFCPERWLEVTDEATKDRMQKAFVVFSTGPRSCLGRNLATMEQQVLAASIFKRFKIHVDKDFVPDRFEAFNLDPGPLPVTIQRRGS